MSAWSIVVLLGGVLTASLTTLFAEQGSAPNLLGSGPGWIQVARRYRPPAALGRLTLRRWQTVQVGVVRWRRCVGVGITEEGLYLKNQFPGMAAMFIPWTAVAAVRPCILYLLPAYELQLVDPPDARLRVRSSLYGHMAQYLASVQQDR
jgi:hypothetical protein